MSFLFPAFLAGSVLIAIPLILHLTRRDVVRRVAFSDVRFVRRVPTGWMSRRWLRELMLLALRVSALLLLVGAFARPYVDDGERAGPAATVIVLDRSFSMDGGGRFAEAKQVAMSVVAEASPAHLLGLVLFDSEAEVASRLTADRSLVRARLSAIEPGSGGTRYAAGLSAAVDLIGPRRGRVVLVTDLQESGWRGESTIAVPSNIEVDVRPVRPIPDNLAVMSIGAGSPSGVSAVVLNAGERRAATLSARVDDRPLVSSVVDLPPGTTAVDLEVSLPGEGVLVVDVSDPDGFLADNRRYALLDPAPVTMVLVVGDSAPSGGASFYIERALQAGDGMGRYVVDHVSPSGLSVHDLSGVGAVVLTGTMDLERPGRARVARFVDEGGGLIVTAGPSVEPTLVADLLGEGRSLRLEPTDGAASTRFLVTATRHPLFATFRDALAAFGQIEVRKSVRLVSDDDTQVLARFADGTPALAEMSVGRGRVIVFASDMGNAWNDFPRRPLFAPFMHELVRHVVGTLETRQDVPAADLPGPLSGTVGPVTLPETGRRVVANVDPAESYPAVLSPETFAARVVETEPVPGEVPPSIDAAMLESAQSYWWRALLAMAVVLCAESWLGRSMA